MRRCGEECGFLPTSIFLRLARERFHYDAAALKRCIESVSSSLSRLVSKQKLTEQAKAAALAAIKTTTELKELSGADFIIEAAKPPRWPLFTWYYHYYYLHEMP